MKKKWVTKNKTKQNEKKRRCKQRRREKKCEFLSATEAKPASQPASHKKIPYRRGNKQQMAHHFTFYAKKWNAFVSENWTKRKPLWLRNAIEREYTREKCVFSSNEMWYGVLAMLCYVMLCVCDNNNFFDLLLLLAISFLLHHHHHCPHVLLHFLRCIVFLLDSLPIVSFDLLAGKYHEQCQESHGAIKEQVKQ